ncbi:MAG: energy-coupling factor ABC transporter permease [Xylanivirga thermophila]|jgi:cobalt/nickel transport system permease protein|uniref:energy-coupling factor ABC transporter permease n=1 Tax=Xylanivirga thermophila TaxID=2496273 RepID=UPI00101D61E9|nr:energy-coupling factor ABC transporter permease [Xylanivirga thermophila]
MSHIHLPDGVLNNVWWLLLSAYVGAILIVYISLKGIDRHQAVKKVPMTGVVAAIMLVTMSIPLGFIPFHINFSVLSGILAGPNLAFTAIFVVNIILAFIGHGGITVAGLNTIIIGVEMYVGTKLFHVFSRRMSQPLSAGFSTFIALMVSTALMFGVLAMSGNLDMEHMLHHHDGHETHITDQAHKGEQIGFGALSVVLLLGFTIESVVTALVVSFLRKVRPDLICI